MVRYTYMLELGQLELYVLYRETKSQVESFLAPVSECKQLESAICFCRYVRWSGLLKLFKTNPQPHPLPVDGYLLESVINELESEVLRRYQTGDVKPRIDAAQLERINHKLDLIAGQLSLVPGLPKVDTKLPPLRIIQGGAE
jgi:hypothetical protein